MLYAFPNLKIKQERVCSHVRTSTNFIIGTGLKKWSPPNLSFLFVTLAISLIGKEEVLDAKIVWLQKTNKQTNALNIHH